MGANLPSVELANPGWEAERRDEPGDQERVDESVLLEELGQPLVSSHPQHISSVKKHVKGATKATEETNQGKYEQFLKDSSHVQAV